MSSERAKQREREREKWGVCSFTCTATVQSHFLPATHTAHVLLDTGFSEEGLVSCKWLEKNRVNMDGLTQCDVSLYATNGILCHIIGNMRIKVTFATIDGNSVTLRLNACVIADHDDFDIIVGRKHLSATILNAQERTVTWKVGLKTLLGVEGVKE